MSTWTRTKGKNMANEIDELCEKWIGLPSWTVHKYFVPSLTAQSLYAMGGTEELTAIGAVGLVRAAKAYDPARISRHTGKPVAFNSFAIPVILNHINNEVRRGITRQLPIAFAPTDPNGIDPIDEIAADSLSPLDDAGEREEYRDLHALIRSLPARHAAVIDLRFFQELPLRDAGNELGVTGERVRQIEIRALERMRAVASASISYGLLNDERTK
jgi:RNA polymerase sigma factor (sigma-70 family)